MAQTTGRAGRGVLSPAMQTTDPYADAHHYYGGQTDASVGRSVHRTRTLSSVLSPFVATDKIGWACRRLPTGCRTSQQRRQRTVAEKSIPW
jgi:hypothetical protein